MQILLGCYAYGIGAYIGDGCRDRLKNVGLNIPARCTDEIYAHTQIIEVPCPQTFDCKSSEQVGAQSTSWR